ncbi:rhodanese-like domain-containing protein [Tamlana sp. 2_MG-2023]|uniref:rhodanese-like domain-containing protein n=1 Tax=unclassified Tamlana TaxID=2614803 RepID=UPI0026E3672D|nr:MULTISPECIES: rhodanese-like domain-containing protein [unclassified Tamlana]MDO6760918.1 rhodanese-like domain-containing protein [Tamlana sp. 2_MG-2023]MDO6791174.1 rhodanese-like domain-containing protein [Tamlana sp. 1_MG-2023]
MKNLILFILFLSVTAGFAQKSLDKLLKKHNNDAVPYITVSELQNTSSEVIYLDARESNEYAVSHLKNAILVGYDFFSIDSLNEIIHEKTSSIVIYCSLGMRSETIGEKLKQNGYTNVKNLYGGIFEWKNNHLPVYNSQDKATDSIHTYSKSWSKWLKNGIKVYE